MRYINLLIIATLYLCGSFTTRATQERNLLIINSYSEYSPWGQSMARPIAFHIAQKENVHCEIANLNNILITDSLQYEESRERLFADNADDHPEYVVLIGQLASTFLPDIKREWGDIPILFISRTDIYGPREMYYNRFDTITDLNDFKHFSDLREEYNFTMVIDRDYPKRTIDMMNELIPAMDSLVFISDGVAINCILNAQISGFLNETYPTIHYRWLQAKQANAEELQHYFTVRYPKTGFLLSTWFYGKDSPQGYPIPSTGDVNILSGSINPIFTLRQSYLNQGAVGGVFPEYDKICERIVKIVDYMLAGQPMRQLPFYDDFYSCPKINYPALESYGLNPDATPDNTVFIDRPENFWGKYKWQLLVAVLVVIMLIMLLVGKNIDQSHHIQVLERHRRFSENMPIPFAKIKMRLDGDDNIEKVDYLMSNQSFKAMVLDNATSGKSDDLFKQEYFAEKAKEVIITGEPVKFDYHFKNSDRYYDFLFSLVDYGEGRLSHNEIDVFAIDNTKRSKIEKELKLLTRRYDLTINMANVIPWQWTLNEDTIIIDAYSLFNRYNRDLENLDDSQENQLSVREFLTAVYEEDRAKLLEIRQQFLDDNIKEFTVKHRIKIARNGKIVPEWVTVSGMAAEHDSQGHTTEIIGSMQIIPAPED